MTPRVAVLEAFEEPELETSIPVSVERFPRLVSFRPEIPALPILSFNEKWNIVNALMRGLLRRWSVWLPSEEIESLVGYCVALGEKHFRPQMGVRYATFIYYHVRGELVRLIAARKAAAAQRDSDSELGALTALCHAASQVKDAEEAAHRQVLSKHCMRALANLSPLERKIIAQHYLEDVPLGELAKRLGYDRSYLYRVRDEALRQLRKQLDD